jgi:hypothetical protein
MRTARSAAPGVIALTLAATALPGCPTPPSAPVAKPAVPRVETHSDSAVVGGLAAAPPYLLAATSTGLDRWDSRDDSLVHLGASDGLPDAAVRAVTLDGSKAWLATDRGIARIDVASARLELAAAPPASAGGSTAELSSVAADGSGGAWVGGGGGLWHVDATGAWLGAGYTRALTALWADDSGEVLLGSAVGLVLRRADGSFRELGAADGVAMAAVRFIATAPDGAPVVVGEDKSRQPVIAFRIGGRWQSFSPSPSVHFVAAAARLDALVLLSADRLWTLSPRRSQSRTLRRDGARLVATAGGGRAPYTVEIIDASVPPGAAAVSAIGEDVFVGTSAVGVARYAAKATRPVWLRHRDLVIGASHLSVACVDEANCYLATGGPSLWRYASGRFDVVSLDKAVREVLAVVRGPDGVVTALYLTDGDARLSVARLRGDRFTPTLTLAVETPGALAGLSFARFSPDGLLWVGLEYLDDDGETRPYGVATVELELGVVTYHRQERRNAAKKKSGILPIPNDVTDVAFDQETRADRLGVWFATASGAAHMELPGEQVQVFTEAEGLDNEILHAVAVSSGGMVYVASTRGVGTFDGEQWAFPRALAVAASALAVSADGRLWIGTDRGVVVYDGQRGLRVVARAGLLSEAVGDLQLDPYGRIWTLSEQGIGIISP